VDWRSAGLRRPSLAQTKVTTIARALVRRKIGHLSSSDLATFDDGLRRAFGL